MLKKIVCSHFYQVCRQLTQVQRISGFCFVEGTPPTPEATQSLLEAIGPIRTTHYGMTTEVFVAPLCGYTDRML